MSRWPVNGGNRKHPLFGQKFQARAAAGGALAVTEGVIVLRVGRVAVAWVIGAAVGLAVAPVGAQSNLDAGKSPAQIFSDTCGACHRSPRELKPTSPGFLREHYTTGGREAATMAAYLASVGSDPRAVQQRRPPALGAKPPAPAETSSTALRPPQTVPTGAPPEQGKPEQGKPETQVALPTTTPSHRTPAASEQAKPAPAQQAATAAMIRPRRPSDSVDAGNPPTGATSAGDADVPAQSVAAPAARPQHPIEQFEE
jgi:hypothetical protein